MAMLYEALLALAVFFFAALPFRAVAGDISPGLMRHLFQIYLFTILGIYFVVCWRRGRTLPMQTWKLRLTGADGKLPGIGQSVLRYVLAWPSLMFFGIGILWALFDRDRQFLHDRLAGTRIVGADSPPSSRE